MKFTDMIKIRDLVKPLIVPVVVIDPEGRIVFRGRDQRLAEMIVHCFRAYGIKCEIGYAMEWPAKSKEKEKKE